MYILDNVYVLYIRVKLCLCVALRGRPLGLSVSAILKPNLYNQL